MSETNAMINEIIVTDIQAVCFPDRINIIEKEFNM